MPPGPTIFLWIQTSGVVIAAISLVITMWNTLATRRAAEAAMIFDLWSRYEAYSSALEQAADSPFELARRPFLDMANFVEHLCYLIEHRAVPKVVRRNLESLVLDYLAITTLRSGASYEAVLGAFRLSSTTYAESMNFIRRHRVALSQRAALAAEGAYGPFKVADPAPAERSLPAVPGPASHDRAPIIATKTLVPNL